MFTPTSDGTSSTRCRFGLFEFDFRTGDLRREGDVVKLAPQPARVLALLLAKPGEVVLREELRAHLWGDETFVDFERGLNFCILQVRGALGDSSDNPRFVQTVPRRGYRFIAPVAPLATSVPTHAPPSPLATSVPAETPPSPLATSVPAHPLGTSVPAEAPPSPLADVPAAAAASRPQILRTGAIAIGAALIVAPLVWLWASGAARNGEGPAAPARIRLAVLPFVNLTGDTAADYVADGLTDELIAQLGRVSPSRLGVIARTSVMRYRTTDKTVADIGRELDVAFVIEGSVRREGTRMRVTTELVNVRDQAQMWSNAFERQAGESMDLQTDVAIRVARALALELVPGVSGPDLPRATAHAGAWDAYLRGRHWLMRGDVDGLRRALEQFEIAVQLDPRFAAGWAQIAEARHVLVMAGVAAPLDTYPRAAEAARRALEIDPALADAHVAAGLVQLWYDWKPDEAARSFARAIAINPSLAAAHHDYAWSLVAHGRFDEAIAEITASRDIDPLSVRANADIGWLYLHIRQPTEAARACQHTLAIQPGSLEAQACLERAYLQRGLYAEALRAAEATLPPGTDIVAPVTGDNASADRIRAIWRWRLERMQEAARSGSSTRWANPYSMAVSLALVGETDRAMEQLEQAYAQRVGVIAFLKTDPGVDALRAHPRFEQLLRKVAQGSS